MIQENYQYSEGEENEANNEINYEIEDIKESNNNIINQNINKEKKLLFILVIII